MFTVRLKLHVTVRIILLTASMNQERIFRLEKPFPNEKVFLLDEEDREVTKPGEKGEICVIRYCFVTWILQ